MRFLPQQPDANFVAPTCKPGAMSMQFWKRGLVNCASSLFPTFSKGNAFFVSVNFSWRKRHSEREKDRPLCASDLESGRGRSKLRLLFCKGVVSRCSCLTTEKCICTNTDPKKCYSVFKAFMSGCWWRGYKSGEVENAKYLIRAANPTKIACVSTQTCSCYRLLIKKKFTVIVAQER